MVQFINKKSLPFLVVPYDMLEKNKEVDLILLKTAEKEGCKYVIVGPPRGIENEEIYNNLPIKDRKIIDFLEL